MPVSKYALVFPKSQFGIEPNESGSDKVAEILNCLEDIGIRANSIVSKVLSFNDEYAVWNLINPLNYNIHEIKAYLIDSGKDISQIRFYTELESGNWYKIF